jgi:hypothetical protein
MREQPRGTIKLNVWHDFQPAGFFVDHAAAATL